jgi:orotate phosphoribosyltransferase
VVLVEDLTTDGKSKINFCGALRRAGASADHAVVVFSLQEKLSDEPARPMIERVGRDRRWIDVR